MPERRVQWLLYKGQERGAKRQWTPAIVWREERNSLVGAEYGSLPAENQSRRGRKVVERKCLVLLKILMH